ncbi:hypothetical protein GIB67_015221 [Kingdonia uniflora]|uniref:Retrotransposon Copia-like N-terminal domain-containing protein n=1 Tax=Kingdonia uniflora TaxID=39325 RepID=A0A7J7MSM2_9MAGN|nr:hypothetical protein GIB67_015221 [Kingdonia uniflora]
MASLSSTPTTIPGISNLAQVAIKLDKTNYMLWKSQLLTILYGTNMLQMVDGTNSSPEEMIMVESDKVINPEIFEWKKMDLILLSWLHAIVTPSVLA